MELSKPKKELTAAQIISRILQKRDRRFNLLVTTLRSCLSTSKGQFPLDKLYKEKSTIGRGTYGDVCIYTYKNKKKNKIIQNARRKLQKLGHDTSDLNDFEMKEILKKAGFESKIAVKKLRPQSDSDEGEIRRMKREEENLRKIRHHHIVQLYGSLLVPDDLAGQRLFLVMEACDGNLRKLCHPELRRQMNEREIEMIVWKILDGLKFMHGHNIMHRDLKPENVLLKRWLLSSNPFPDWETVDIDELDVKICDFGFSRLVSSTSGVQSLSPWMGTEGYRAPEVLEGGNYHKKADVFSVGVIMFELEHKRRPTKEEYEAVENGHRVSKYGKSGDRMLRMLQRDPERRPTANVALFLYGDFYYRFRLHGELRDQMLRMLQRDPEKRPTAMEAHEIF